MDKRKWWSFEALWVGLLGSIIGLAVLGLGFWKAHTLENGLQVGAVFLGGLVILSLGLMMLIGYVQEVYSSDDEDEPVAQHSHHEVKV